MEAVFRVVVKPRATLRGRCQITLSSTDKAKMSKSAERAEEREAATADVVDSESDASASEGEEEPAARDPTPEPEPAPKKVKKVVKRRVVAAT